MTQNTEKVHVTHSLDSDESLVSYKLFYIIQCVMTLDHLKSIINIVHELLPARIALHT